jgi:hypothetical protein
MKRRTSLSLAMLLAILLAVAPPHGRGCTTAVVGAAAGAGGRPLLWKNRDTDFLNNKVLFVSETPYSYLALVNAEDRSGRWAYAGLNAAGFAIFNSVAYNLPEAGGEMKDLEGTIMADALRRCASVDDFESYLRESLGPSLGSLANFGVIDARGGAAIFEVSNRAFRKHAVADAAAGYLVNTNFARSGEPGAGAGYLRFERASALLRALPPAGISVEALLGRVSRDTGHALLGQPSFPEFRAQTARKPLWLCTRDTIDRESTSAAVVVVGRGAGGAPATLWVQLGEPLCSVAVPLWVEAGAVPAALREGATAPLLQEALRLKKLARPYEESDRREYLLASRLDNREGSGFLPGLLAAEREIFARSEAFLATAPSAAAMAAFQEEMALKALAALKAAH